MTSGVVFDIREFSINDGPGVRTVVFMKGCPLKCKWCHNPEGIQTAKQLNFKTNRMVGEIWSSDALADKLLIHSGFKSDSGGLGITFSGGEPTLQGEFIIECADRLTGVHKLLDTSGYCDPGLFSRVIKEFDAVYFDLKLADEEKHKEYTGVSNSLILQNLQQIVDANKELTIRMPMIPHITDTRDNLEGNAKIIRDHCSPDTVIHILPYNKYAGGKYPIYGMEYPLSNWYRKENIEEIRRFIEDLSSRGYKVISYIKE